MYFMCVACAHHQWLCSFRDDAFSDNLSQKADSEASSGPLLDDKGSSKNDAPSPCEQSPDYNFGGVMGRWIHLRITPFFFSWVLLRSFPVWLLVWSDPSPQGEVTVRWSCHPTSSEWHRHPQSNQSGWHSTTGCSLSQQPPQGVHQQESYREPRKEAPWHFWQCGKHQLPRQEGLSWGPPSETSARGHSSQQPRGPQITGDWSAGRGKGG